MALSAENKRKIKENLEIAVSVVTILGGLTFLGFTLYKLNKLGLDRTAIVSPPIK